MATLYCQTPATSRSSYFHRRAPPRPPVASSPFLPMIEQVASACFYASPCPPSARLVFLARHPLSSTTKRPRLLHASTVTPASHSRIRVSVHTAAAQPSYRPKAKILCRCPPLHAQGLSWSCIPDSRALSLFLHLFAYLCIP